MIGKELKRLSRRELVEVIYQLKRSEEQLKEEVAALRAELQDKQIRMSVVGSLADAAATVTQLFSTAQMTADVYLHEITRMKEETEAACAKMLEEARAQSESEGVGDGE